MKTTVPGRCRLLSCRPAILLALLLSVAVSCVAAETAGEQAALACVAGERVVHGTALTVPRARLAGAGAEEASVFRAAYALARNSGTLTRAPLVRGPDGSVRELAPLWDAAAVLAQAEPAGRRIFTLGGAGAAPVATVPFVWDALSTAQQALLDRPPGAVTAPDGLGPARVAWLRGVRDREGVDLRLRTGLLGDAVHGVPVFAGPGLDSPEHAGDDAYRAFQARTRHRTPAVYLGANDGMLHAFDARTGTELFAYVPAMLYGTLNELPAPGYTHRPYVDGPLAIGEARLQDGWHTVLAGSPGMGARGLFALDVTDPADFAGGQGALWEFTGQDDAVLGNVLTPPQIARLQVRSRGGPPRYRHFVVTGGGIGGAGDATGAALFLLALDKPAGQAWRRDTDYYRLDTPAGVPGISTGLSAPALVPDDDNILRHAYAGDLQGNLWRFDFTGAAPWHGGSSLRPVFVARDAQGRRQPIAQQPKVVHANGGGYLVLFGTGTLFSRADRSPAQFTPQSFYAIHDDPAHPAAAAPGRGDLLERRIAPDARAGSGFSVSGRNQAVGAGARPKGWYVDFAAAVGERSIAGATIVDGRVAFATVVPGPDPCADSTSRLYVLDTLSGLAADENGVPASGATAGVLLPGFLEGPPLLLPAARPRVPGHMPGPQAQVLRTTDVMALGADGTASRVATSRSVLPAGRLSWREVVNWRQLHGAAIRQAAAPRGPSVPQGEARP